MTDESSAKGCPPGYTLLHVTATTRQFFVMVRDPSEKVRGSWATHKEAIAWAWGHFRGKAEGIAANAVEPCWTCGGDPTSHPSGALCICKDGTHAGEVLNLRIVATRALQGEPGEDENTPEGYSIELEGWDGSDGEAAEPRNVKLAHNLPDAPKLSEEQLQKLDKEAEANRRTMGKGLQAETAPDKSILSIDYKRLARMDEELRMAKAPDLVFVREGSRVYLRKRSK